MTPYRDILSVPLPNIRRPQPLLPDVPTPRIGISHYARVNGFGLIAPRGHGKSRLLGRNICYQDALRRVPTVVFDVMGATIDNALDKLLYLDRTEQLEVGERLRYCNMAGERVGTDTYVSGWPMFTRRFSNERLFLTSQRPVELIRKTDWALARASVQGLNRLAPLLTSIAIVLTALGEPISQAYDVLDNTEKWRQRLTNLAFAAPDTREACLFLV